MNEIKGQTNGATQKVYLREKFSDLHENLEGKISSIIKEEMESWGADVLTLFNQSLTPTMNQSAAMRRRTVSERKSKFDGIPHHEFIARPSLLTELLSVIHFQSLYNIFVAILFILTLNKALDEISTNGSLDLGLSLTLWAFGKFENVVYIWLCMKLSTTILVYGMFHYWAHNRHKSPRVYDIIGAILVISYLTLLLQLPTMALLRYDLPPASSFALLCEQVRMFMKTWAFIRSNLYRAVSYKKDDSSKSPCPNFSQYLYFLFAPTLIYRDEYPRNKDCQWSKVIRSFMQVIGCILYAHFMLANFCIPALHKFGREEFTKYRLMVAVFSCCFPGVMLLLSGFFALLHSWMNAFAEMLRFADRTFYKDWWNSTSYARFYRTWNCVVHDWLHEYVFKEMTNLQRKYGGPLAYFKFLPVLLVFFISSVVHEYLLSFAFRFFYPVLLICFGGFGVLFMFINTRNKFFNVFLWMSLILGTGLLTCTYTIEWYARKNCPAFRDDIFDYAIPRSWFCLNNFTASI